MTTDLQKRVEAGYGSPMLGTRWTLYLPHATGCRFKEHLTFTELIAELRKKMLATPKEQSFEFRVRREDY